MKQESRTKELHRIARDYVEKGLGLKNFDNIPYHDNVELRAPLCPGGSATPLRGKEQLREIWWAPLPDLVKSVELFDSYVNRELNGATVEFHCTISEPACVLRIMDRFKIDESGKIIVQENFFDPRSVLGL